MQHGVDTQRGQQEVLSKYLHPAPRHRRALAGVTRVQRVRGCLDRPEEDRLGKLGHETEQHGQVSWRHRGRAGNSNQQL